VSEAGRPALTAMLCRGVQRMLFDRGYAPLTEMTLANGRRADIVGIDRKGEILIVETKSGLDDYIVDFKWPDYVAFCDAFYFAVATDFPRSVISDDVGLIVADGFGGEIIREAPRHPLSGARRKAVTIGFARLAATRLLTSY
jgi:hypothetical protein